MNTIRPALTIALALAVCPAFALTPDEEQELAQRMSAGGKPPIIRLNDVEIEDYKRAPNASGADDKTHEFLVIRAPGEEPIKLAAYSFGMRTLQVGGGPGPNAIYVASSGVGQCCVAVHLIWIEHRAHHQEIALLGSDLRIEARGGPPRLRFEDRGFVGSDAPTAAARGPEVVLAYDPRRGEYALDPDAMRKPPPSDAELAGRATELRQKLQALPAEEAKPTLSVAMLDLIYSGNAVSARALLDAARPEANPGKEEFLSDFTRGLWASETWRRFDLGRLLEADQVFPRPAGP